MFRTIASPEIDWSKVKIEMLMFYHFRPPHSRRPNPQEQLDIELDALFSIRTIVTASSPTKRRAQIPVALKHNNNIRFARLEMERQMPLKRKTISSGRKQ